MKPEQIEYYTQKYLVCKIFKVLFAVQIFIVIAANTSYHVFGTLIKFREVIIHLGIFGIGFIISIALERYFKNKIK